MLGPVLLSGLLIIDWPREATVRFSVHRHKKQRLWFVRIERRERWTFFEVDERFIRSLFDALAFVGQRVEALDDGEEDVS